MSTPTQIEGNLQDYSFSRDGDGIIVSETSNPSNTATTPDNSQVEFNDGNVTISSTFDNTIAATDSISDEAPTLTTLTDGGYVLSWTSWAGEFVGVNVQRYNASGELLQETRMPMSGADGSSVTALAGGKFILVWATDNANDTGSVYTQQFDATGNKTGNQVLVATTTADKEIDKPSVTVLADGKYIVTWGEEREIRATTEIGSALDVQYGGEEDGRYDVDIVDIKSKVYTNGTASTTQTLYTGSAATGEAQNMDIMAKVDGSFWMTWSVEKATGENEWGATYTTEYYVRPFSATGAATGPQLPLQSIESNYPHASYFSVVAASDGYVVSWVGDVNSARDIYTQHYDQNFVASGEPVRVTDDSVSINGASITATIDGGYLLSWAGLTGYVDENTYELVESGAVYAQRFSADGTARDAEAILVASVPEGFQAWNAPAATVLADGGFVVSWELANENMSFNDLDEDDVEYDLNVYAQRFDAAGEPAGKLITTITGDSGNNSLIWTGTEDVILSGEDGDDTLQGGDGDDLLDGGSGDDTAVFSDGSQNYTLGML